MSSDPRSEWYSTPKERRHRKPLAITLSPEAREILELLAERAGTSRSATVEALLMENEDAAIR